MDPENFDFESFINGLGAAMGGLGGGLAGGGMLPQQEPSSAAMTQLMENSPALESLAFVYTVAVLDILKNSPRARKRVLSHLVGMYGYRLEKAVRSDR